MVESEDESTVYITPWQVVESENNITIYIGPLQVVESEGKILFILGTGKWSRVYIFAVYKCSIDLFDVNLF